MPARDTRNTFPSITTARQGGGEPYQRYFSESDREVVLRKPRSHTDPHPPPTPLFRSFPWSSRGAQKRKGRTAGGIPILLLTSNWEAQLRKGRWGKENGTWGEGCPLKTKNSAYLHGRAREPRASAAVATTPWRGEQPLAASEAPGSS